MNRKFNLKTLSLTFLISLLPLTSINADSKSSSVQHGERELSATVKAKVLDINYKTREITLQTTDGYKTTLVASNEIKNFDKVKKGDTIVADYTAEVDFVVNKERKPASETATSSVDSIPGNKPAGKAEKKMKTTVTVTNIDRKTPSITVKSADGEKNTFHVQHPEKLAGVQVGDLIDITFSEALALRVEK